MRALYFIYLKVLGSALWRNSKEIYCISDITDYVQKDHWYEGNICTKYGGTSFTYGIFTPKPRDLWWFFV